MEAPKTDGGQSPRAKLPDGAPLRERCRYTADGGEGRAREAELAPEA